MTTLYSKPSATRSPSLTSSQNARVRSVTRVRDEKQHRLWVLICCGSHSFMRRCAEAFDRRRRRLWWWWCRKQVSKGGTLIFFAASHSAVVCVCVCCYRRQEARTRDTEHRFFRCCASTQARRLSHQKSLKVACCAVLAAPHPLGQGTTMAHLFVWRLGKRIVSDYAGVASLSTHCRVKVIVLPRKKIHDARTRKKSSARGSCSRHRI